MRGARPWQARHWSVQEIPTFKDVRSLAPAEFRRWVLYGSTIGFAAYGAFVLLDVYRRGPLEALTSGNAVMMLLCGIAGVIGARISAPAGAMLGLFAAWSDQLSGFASAGEFPFASYMQLPPLVLAAGLLFGARMAMGAAIVTSILTALATVNSPALRGGLTAQAQDWLVSVTVSLFVSWALVAITMTGFRRLFDAMVTTQRDYADTIRFTPHGIIVVDPSGTVMLENDMAEALLGLTGDEATGRPIAEVLGTRAGAPAALAPLADWTAPATIEVAVPLPDDSTLHLEGTWRAMTGGRHQLLLHDVSPRVRAEEHRREIETQLAHSQRLDAVGRLAGGLAHDFNNILTAVSGSAEMLRYERNPTERSALLDEIIAARDRGASLTRQLLAFARREVTQPRVVDLGVLVHDLERLLQRVLGDRARARFELAPDCCVLVDPGQLEQALVNLVANARDAMPDGGTCTVTVERVVDARATSHIRVHVSDEGVGMAPEVAERAFEPFFTTKPRGQGTGLGLASVHGMVEQSGGRVHIASTRGRGTRLTLEFPASDQPASRTAVTAPAMAPAPGRHTVLVVDDDSGTRRIVERLLKHAGHEVRTTTDAIEAMALIEDGRTPFDLLLSDVVMPGFTGPELAERVRALHPGTPVLLMTGYAEDHISGILDAASRDGVITKPFSGTELTTRIAQLIRAAVPATA